MSNAAAPYQDPQLQVLRINDFSPGIHQWTVGTAKIAYTPEAPVGAASWAVRCINRPGVGLVPFPTRQAVAVVAPVDTPDPGTSVYCTGILAFGPVIENATSQWPQNSNTPIDQLFVSLDYVSGGNRYRQVTRVNSDGTSDTLLHQSLGSTAAHTFRFCPDFVVTRILQNGAAAGTPPTPVVAWPELDLNNVYLCPGVASATYPLVLTSAIVFAGNAIHVMAHESRLIVLNAAGFLEVSAGNQAIYSDEDQFTTDPPESYTLPLGVNTYDPEHFSGFGAWGSISSGELLVIHRGGGAYLIEGDARAPSGVVKLPGVAGTGKIMQKAVQTAAGLVYVTETDGVYAWNGSNTAQKISQQIPDPACLRAELLFNAVGTLSQHDQINNLVFFANNWVFDAVGGSWWLAEDPAVATLSAFARSSGAKYMFAAAGLNSTPGPITISQFVLEGLSSTWEWLSTPIPVGAGGLVDVEWVEIVATNIALHPATITVTPQTPAGTTGIAGNNPQSVVFDLPASASGFRLSQRLGYRDYNIQLDVAAAASGLFPAPILHEINVGYSVVAPTGIS